MSYGEISARDYIWQLTVDLTVHAWDLARGIGADERLDHELVRRIHAETEKDAETSAAAGCSPRRCTCRRTPTCRPGCSACSAAAASRRLTGPRQPARAATVVH